MSQFHDHNNIYNHQEEFTNHMYQHSYTLNSVIYKIDFETVKNVGRTKNSVYCKTKY